MTGRARRRVEARLSAPEDAGTPLPEGVRRQAEQAFARDFSHVRVHEDAPVDHLGAVAATLGSSIHLAPSAPPLTTPEGQRLLVHELTHVTQQPGTPPAVGEPPSVSHPGDPAEREASAVAEGRVSPAADHGVAAPATLHRSGLVPVPVVPPGVPPGLIAQQVLGEVTVGATSYGTGTALTFQSGATVTGATVTVASETTVTVGAATIGSEVTVVSGGSLAAAPAAGVGAAAAAGIVVVGALVVAGSILWIAKLASEHREAEPAPGREPGTKDLLPGGAPPPVVIAPPPVGQGPVQAPGAAQGGPVTAPGATNRGPVTAPGAPGAGPVKAPAVIDDPDACLRLVTSNQPHWHHIFPREYVNEFEYLGIHIDDFTVKLPPDQHIGRRGVHLVLDWNAEWGEFFQDVPNDLSDARRVEWAYRAIDKAIDLMGEMRKHLRRTNLHQLVRFRTNQPSPVVPPQPTK